MPEYFENNKKKSIKRGADFLVSLQDKNGSWYGDYSGPMFLLPMYVCALYISKKTINKKDKAGIIRYIKRVQNKDGSIGIHVEDTGSMFTTVLNYIAVRLLGEPSSTPFLVKMRSWIQANGTPVASASWGKFFLAILDLYPYDGLNPILPELWLLPYLLPFHPGRLWCHARQVYLPMAYLYGIKAKIPRDDLMLQIRKEIYAGNFEDIKFENFRDTIADADNYRPYSRILKAVNKLMLLYEKYHSKRLRKKSVLVLLKHIKYEDNVTNFIDIGPVNSILNAMVNYFYDEKSCAAKKSFEALKYYIWREDDEVRINGYNSTALWDTAFAVQAIEATHIANDYIPSLKKAYEYIKNNQVVLDVPHDKRYFRHPSRGGWPFSNVEHGWPISDCTAEGFKSAVALEKFVDDTITNYILLESIKLILSLQNRDGGWATYEKKRGGDWLELFNPSSVFGDIMIDYSYVECTSACIQALERACLKFPEIKNKIKKAINRGKHFILKKQRSDGSWEGSWGVCFTYGTWFGVWGLISAGVDKNAPEIQKACSFLLKHQNEDGGWGESYLSCKLRYWVNHKESQSVNTSWALMTLIKAGMKKSEAVEKGLRFLVKRQQDNGDWPKESLAGIFNKTTLINYENYRRYFPLWALSMYTGT